MGADQSTDAGSLCTKSLTEGEATLHFIAMLASGEAKKAAMSELLRADATFNQIRFSAHTVILPETGLLFLSF